MKKYWRFRIGAGTLITVLLALVIGGYGVVEKRHVAARPVVVERSVEGVRLSDVAPAPEFLLRHSAELRLSSAEVVDVERIAVAYRRDIAPYQPQLTSATIMAKKKMERTAQGTRPEIQQLQNAAVTVRDLSGVMSATRHSYWQQARGVLTAKQRVVLDGLLPAASLRDFE